MKYTVITYENGTREEKEYTASPEMQKNFESLREFSKEQERIAGDCKHDGELDVSRHGVQCLKCTAIIQVS